MIARRSSTRVLKNEGFLELPWYLVKSLVREGDLQVDEADLFAAAQAWVDRDPAERLQHVEEVREYFTLPVSTLCCLVASDRAVDDDCDGTVFSVPFEP